MKEAWEKFENRQAAGLAVVLIWGGMILSIMWGAVR